MLQRQFTFSLALAGIEPPSPVPSVCSSSNDTVYSELAGGGGSAKALALQTSPPAAATEADSASCSASPLSPPGFDFSHSSVAGLAAAYLSARSARSAAALMALWEQDPPEATGFGGALAAHGGGGGGGLFGGSAAPADSALVTQAADQHRHCLSDGSMAFGNRLQAHHHLPMYSTAAVRSCPALPVELFCPSVRRKWGIADAHLRGRRAIARHFEKLFDAVPSSTLEMQQHHQQAPTIHVCTLMALMAGATKRDWSVLYRQGSHDEPSDYFTEVWELSEQGKLRSVRRFEPSQ
jgi:hypothetical protein